MELTLKKSQEVVLDIDLNKVTKIYFGQDRACRCGCKGEYFEGLENILSMLDEIKALRSVEEVDAREAWINISLPRNKAYTIYFN